MDILREFLESSTIHGLIYISTAKVKLFEPFSESFVVDQVRKNPLVLSCLLWVHLGWCPDRQVLQGLAGESHLHVDHHPPHR